MKIPPSKHTSMHIPLFIFLSLNRQTTVSKTQVKESFHNQLSYIVFYLQQLSYLQCLSESAEVILDSSRLVVCHADSSAHYYFCQPIMPPLSKQCLNWQLSDSGGRSMIQPMKSDLPGTTVS